MANYFRVGNRTLTESEMKFMTQQQLEQLRIDGEIANQARLERIRAGFGMEPKKITLDVTPAGVAARKAAIEAEEARIAAETKSIDVELGEAGSFLGEGEPPETPAKTREQKAEERRLRAEAKKLKAEAVA